jgi:hypothetical protein
LNPRGWQHLIITGIFLAVAIQGMKFQRMTFVVEISSYTLNRVFFPPLLQAAKINRVVAGRFILKVFTMKNK